ncbi:hypothetical protein HOD08_01270 [bacterium]|jgi:hypothetical protein|nr:hypothetical protein [bacterium]
MNKFRIFIFIFLFSFLTFPSLFAGVGMDDLPDDVINLICQFGWMPQVSKRIGSLGRIKRIMGCDDDVHPKKLVMAAALTFLRGDGGAVIAVHKFLASGIGHHFKDFLVKKIARKVRERMLSRCKLLVFGGVTTGVDAVQMVAWDPVGPSWRSFGGMASQFSRGDLWNLFTKSRPQEKFSTLREKMRAKDSLYGVWGQHEGELENMIVDARLFAVPSCIVSFDARFVIPLADQIGCLIERVLQDNYYVFLDVRNVNSVENAAQLRDFLGERIEFCQRVMHFSIRGRQNISLFSREDLSVDIGKVKNFFPNILTMYIEDVEDAAGNTLFYDGFVKYCGVFGRGSDKFSRNLFLRTRDDFCGRLRFGG